MARQQPVNEARFWAGGFLYDPRTKAVLLHKRDENTCYNPCKWAFFGGMREPGEKPVTTCLREFKEELDVDLAGSGLVLLNHDYQVSHGTYRYVFFSLRAVAESVFRLGEGLAFAWIPLSEVFEHDLTEKTRTDLLMFRSLLLGEGAA